MRDCPGVDLEFALPDDNRFALGEIDKGGWLQTPGPGVQKQIRQMQEGSSNLLGIAPILLVAQAGARAGDRPRELRSNAWQMRLSGTRIPTVFLRSRRILGTCRLAFKMKG